MTKPLAILTLAAALTTAQAARAETIPPSTATALDGHTVTLPRDLAPSVTILILGFSRHSADTTTAWEKAVRPLADTPHGIGFYDMPMLAEVPNFVRPLVLRSIRKQVPDFLKPNFVPLLDSEDAWKQLAAYTPSAPDAAYVLLVDRAGNVRWQTHEPFSQPGLDRLAAAARFFAAAPK